ncbi:cyclic dehypoxanthinyl futalosine synthase [Streptomyces ambofaciens]
MTEKADLQPILDRAAAGGRITPEEALVLYRDAPLHALGAAADAVRRRRYAGTEHIATYIIERNINYTNVCVTACKFCAFYAAPKDTKKGWTRELDDILRRCAETVELGGTQIMFQGGHHPDYGVEYYEKHFAAIKQEFPQLVIHSLGASEVEHMARISKVSVEEAIQRIHAAGLDSFAGAGAELLPERPRKAIAPLKESGERWLEIMEIAHGLGVESTSTMLMGTGETNAERIEHLRMIRDVQDRTGGFRAFIPYTYQPENNHLKGRTQATLFEYLRMIAIARVFLDNVAHIQGSWLTTGKEVGQLSLHYGAGRPRLDHAGGERRLLRRRQAPVQPAGDHRPDPQGGTRPGAAGHDVRAPRRARRPGERPGRRARRLPHLLHGDRGRHGAPRAEAARVQLTPPTDTAE